MFDFLKRRRQKRRQQETAQARQSAALADCQKETDRPLAANLVTLAALAWLWAPCSAHAQTCYNVAWLDASASASGRAYVKGQVESGNANAIMVPLAPTAVIKLTSAHDGVPFDIYADGSLPMVAWTEADEDVALLAYDENGNGRIDDASELFGDHTVPGVHNGITALRVLSGGAGSIDNTNPFFARLLLWTDRNHNGISEPDELEPFSAHFSQIGLGALKIDRRDGYGNEYRLQGWTLQRVGPGRDVPSDHREHVQRERPIYDVFLTVEK